MILSLFDLSFFKQRVYQGIIDFFILIALAMAVIAPVVALPPAILAVVVSFVFYILEYKSGYISVALSVCKNE